MVVDVARGLFPERLWGANLDIFCVLRSKIVVAGAGAVESQWPYQGREKGRFRRPRITGIK
jgi:hypothetical protein